MTRPAVALADTIARRLASAGTRVVYGVPGGGNNLEVVGACERAGLRFVLAMERVRRRSWRASTAS